MSLESASLKTEVTRNEPNNKQLAVLGAAVLIPVVATANLFSLWLTKPSAAAVSTGVWLFGIFWVPPRPRMKLWLWVIIVALCSVAAYLLAVFGVAPFG